jgi:hypothetical protein
VDAVLCKVNLVKNFRSGDHTLSLQGMVLPDLLGEGNADQNYDFLCFIVREFMNITFLVKHCTVFMNCSSTL